MAFLVEKGLDDVQFELYKITRHAFIQKLEIEAVKQLAKAELEREANIKKKKNGGQSADDTE